MQIATWNINGIKARLEVVQAWLQEAKPDIVCLQEIKSVDEAFPAEPFETLGYNVATHGQKGFNGVAILSRMPLEDVRSGLPGDDKDEQARYIEAVAPLGGGVLRFGGLYLPNGNPVDSDKYPYKLSWMDRLLAHARNRLELEEPLLFLGDFNVIPEPRDARRPDAWEGDALFLPESRQKLRAIEYCGFTDAVRMFDQSEGVYTFWDYQGGAWQKNDGIRIDHILMSPQATDLARGVRIDKHVRSWEKPSDHVPVVLEIG